ncbi:MAG: radical SAM family heme chaperone HemW [Proteobacteria bacterium]|nr:radical SAM family heme chaperone HemW [Pseudomonadota bacterium]
MNGLYIHVPFCVRKCLYCNFYSVTDLGMMAPYVEALVREMDLTAALQPTGLKSVDTLYFGGGTPSVLSFNHLGRIMDRIHHLYHVADHAEITLEVNPGTLTPGALDDFKRLGINRLSLGVQSFHDTHLQMLGRIHSSDESRALIHAARKAGFNDLGLDLIYGLPGQSLEHWQDDLENALSFGPSHLSCYMLSFEPGTPLFKRMKKGTIVPLPDDKAAILFDETMAFLEKKGFIHYEISNFASSPGTQSRHNRKYWNFEPYTGFGPSAHSYTPVEQKRSWNVPNLSDYIDRLKKGHLPVEDSETLDKRQQMIEALFLGLRKMEGILISEFNRRFECDFSKMFSASLSYLSKNGLIVHDPARVYLTRKGIVLADRITSLFVDRVD